MNASNNCVLFTLNPNEKLQKKVCIRKNLTK